MEKVTINNKELEIKVTLGVLAKLQERFQLKCLMELQERLSSIDLVLIREFLLLSLRGQLKAEEFEDAEFNVKDVIQALANELARSMGVSGDSEKK